MQPVLDDFEKRVKDVEKYFTFLKNVENGDIIKKNQVRKSKIPDDVTKILKANMHLLLYNLVESSVKASVIAIYDDIKDNNLGYDQLNEKLIKLWVKRKYKDKRLSNDVNFVSFLEEMISDAVTNTVFELDEKAIDISGNLDARKIKEIAEKHGFSSTVHKNSNNGTDLLNIKTARNKLAHGEECFSDMGGNLVISDLERYKKCTIIFLRSILRNVQKYISEQSYLS